MKRMLSLCTTAFTLAALAAPVHAQMSHDVMVGGQSMSPSKDIVETLKGKGPFTVFAPTNDAFAKLPAGTVETLLKPEMKTQLTGVLTYHVVAGRYDAAALMKEIRKGGGTATLKTVNGATLTLTMNGPMNVVVKDAKGGVANISTYDVIQSNGVIHVIDQVLLPAS